MKNCLHYKEYVGSVEFAEEDGVFHGKVIGIAPVISFEGESVNALTQDFRAAIDEYLEYCAQESIKPEKPYKGSFNVRIHPELHRKAAQAASLQGLSLNAFVEDAIRKSAEAPQ